MQTFVPYADFEASARALDQKRLGKQRVEVIQIVRALTVPGYAWSQHPAVLMWKGYEEALGRYGLTMCEVWLELGFGDTCAATIAADLTSFGISEIRGETELAAAGRPGPPTPTRAAGQRVRPEVPGDSWAAPEEPCRRPGGHPEVPTSELLLPVEVGGQRPAPAPVGPGWHPDRGEDATATPPARHRR